MAKLYGEIAAKALLTLDKSFARANGQPLDASEVYYSLQAAKDYAATAQAYIGQKIVVVENNVVTHYSIEDAAGNLKELGSTLAGDEKSITIKDDTISLVGVDSLVFKREVDVLDEDGQPTGEKKTEEAKYQPLMTKTGLVWVEPSKTTVEGLATLIDELTQRVNALETKVGTAAKPETSEGADDGQEATGLYAEIDKKADKETTYTKTEVNDAIDAAVKGILGDDVKEAYDTLKEIQDILEGTDGETIDGLIETVADNKQKIEILNGTGEGSIDQKIIDAIGTPGKPAEGDTEAVAGTGIHANIYSKSETDALIAAAAQNTTTVANELTAYKTSNDTRVKAVEDKVKALEEVEAEKNVIIAVEAKAENSLLTAEKIITDTTNRKVVIDDSAIVASIADAKKAGTDAQGTANAANTTANAASEKANTNESNINALTGRMTTVEGKATQNAADITALNGRVAINEGAIKTINETALPGKADKSVVEGLSTSLGTLQGTVNGHTTEIEALKTGSQTKAEAKTEHDAIIALIGKPTTTEGETTTPATGVYVEIEKKANKATTLAGYGITDAYTKGETDSAIATAVANAGHLKRVIVDTLPVTEIDTNTIYMVPTIGDNIFDDNIYDEYMYINGKWEKIGTTETDLTQYATKEYVDNAIADIPLATLTRGENDTISIVAGLIKPVDKKFEVENGEVKKISTDLLVNGETELILYGGNAGVFSAE